MMLALRREGRVLVGDGTVVRLGPETVDGFALIPGVDEPDRLFDECSEVTGEHFHRRCMRCRHRWAEQTSERPKPLSLRVLGNDVELTCVCGLTLVQPLRAVIEERCPRCRREWRR